tara:strand:- start:11639 stop:12058 length:420 start_codon:yes stop_codon:yes gene_type:complete
MKQIQIIKTHAIRSLFLLGLSFVIISCAKENDYTNYTVISNDGYEARRAYTEKGYVEVEVTPIVKSSCYFSKWDKTIMTPVSGLFEYYDLDENWVASIDFGDGTCDEWATKSWDIALFPEYPSGTEDFSVFSYGKKKTK